MAIFQESVKITQPGENDLTRSGAGDVIYIEPQEILKNINPKDMIDVLEKGYQEKLRKKQHN